MLMSHRHKFIFIHIYKTAGTSIREEFVPYARLIDYLAYGNVITRKALSFLSNILGWHDDGMRQFTGFYKHDTAQTIEDKLGRDLFASYFRFAFVRNPFDHLVSLYHYIQQDRHHWMHEKASGDDFGGFLRWYLSEKPPRQIDFLMSSDHQRRLVDHVGRFETLVEDVGTIKQKIGIEDGRHLSHANPSRSRKKGSFQQYYDGASRALVEDYFAEDLSLLGYDFDGYSESIPLME